MPVQRIPVRGGFYALTDRHWSSQDLLNMISLPSETGNTKTELSLVQAPGPRPFCEFGDGAIRGLRNVEGKLFTVSGTQLYQISATGVAIPRGTIPGVGRVSMTHNQFGNANQLVIDNGSARYVFNTVTLVLEKVTDESFPGSFCSFYVDQYLGFVEPQGRYWGHSDLADALNYNSLDTYEAEADPDRIISAFVSHREVLIFGKDTIEPFVNSPVGDGTAPFVRASNTVIECGCAARFSVAGMDNSVFWLDDKRIVRRLDGYTPVRISNAGIEQALAECTPGDISRAFAFVYEDQGFKVYYLTVPGQFTFGYDLRTQEWHRRSSPGRNDWRLSDLVFWEGQWIGGDRAAGRLYILDWNYSFDGTEELVREWDSGALFADQRRIEVNEIEVLASVGAPTETVGAFPAQPAAPTITGDAPDAIIGDVYSFSYTLGSGTPPYATTLRSGALPAGLSLSAAGVISGTPTVSGSHSFTVRVTDANGLWDEVEDEISAYVDTPVLTTDLRHYFGPRDGMTVAAADIGFPSATNLVAISPNGLYAVGAENDGGTGLSFAKFNTSTSLWELLTAPAVNDAQILGMKWSPTGDHVAVCRDSNGDAKLTVYRLASDVLTAITSPTGLSTAIISDVAWNLAGTRLYMARGNSGQQSAYADFTPGTDTFSAAVIVGQAGLGGGIFVQPNADDTLLAGVGSGGYLYVWDITGTPALKASLLVADSLTAHWDVSYTRLIVLNDGASAPWIQLYEYDATPGMEAITLSGVVISQPADNPVALSAASAITSGHDYFAVAITNQAYPEIYDIGTVDVVTKLAALTTSGANVTAVSWSQVNP